MDQLINDITINKECNICNNKFINLTYKTFDKFMEDNKNILPNTFEEEYCCRQYIDRFECLICKDVKICRECYWNFKNHKFTPNEDDAEDYEYFNGLDEDGLSEGRPGDDCPIICPYCRQPNYKIFYENEMPYELLTDIKNHYINRKK
jgi:hypothetical protein